MHADDHTACDLQAIRNTCQSARTAESLAIVDENWGLYYDEMLRTGRLSDKTMAITGVEEDMKGSDGRVRNRDTNVESHRRFQLTSSKPLQAERTLAVMELQAKREAEVALEKAKVEQILATASVTEEKIVTAMTVRRASAPTPHDQGVAALCHATLDDVMSSKVGVEGLKALLHSRTYVSFKATKKWPNRGTVAKVASGETNLLSMFLELKAKPIILKAPALVAAVVVVPAILPVSTLVASNGASGGGAGSVGGGGGGGGGGLASEWLTKPGWLARMLASTTGSVEGASISEHSGTLADQLASRLEELLREHIAVRAPSKHDHWVWIFVRKNLARIAAWLAVSGLIKANVNQVKAGNSLLRPSKMTRVAGDIGNLHGAYGHVHEGALVRSGKVVRFTSGGFNKRNPEHQKCAELLTAADLDSGFYTKFPTRTSPYVVLLKQLGWWEELELVVLLGFDLKNAAATKALCDTSTTQGLLCWSAFDLTRIGGVNFRGASTLEEKQLHMAGYLFELVFDLMIARDDNVSKNPGFETPLGIF